MPSRIESFIGLASSDDLRIALHYKNAAQILYKSNDYQDIISLPFLFLTRQFLELGLKYNIKILNEVSTCNDLITNLNNVHELNKLYQAFLAHYKNVKKIKKINGLSEKKLLEGLKKLIDKISLLDFNSQGYRYSESKKGKKLIKHEETFNLNEIFVLLEDSSNFLSGVEYVLCLNTETP